MKLNGKKRISAMAIMSRISYDETISTLAREIVKKEESFANIILSSCGKIQMMDLIQSILSKRQKTSDDILVLIEYLKTLKDFIASIKGDNDEAFVQEVLSKLVKSLNVQEISNSILFHIGEKGSLFYIILKGTVSILIPKEIKRHVTPEEYLTHLLYLDQLEERELCTRTINSNKKIYEANITNPANPVILNCVHKPISYLPREAPNGTAEEYVESLIPVTTQEEKSIHPALTFWIYHLVIKIGEGRTFGEQALISKNSLRTATIFANEETFLGILNEVDFASSIKSIQIQSKREKIQFILRYGIFGSVSYDYFTKHFWNNFILIKKKYGDVLFNQNDKRDMVYFIKEGEVDLTCKLSLNDINILLIYFGVDSSKLYMEHGSDKPKSFKIAAVKSNSLLGADDVLFPNKRFFCSAQCSSKAEIFAIEIANLLKIIDFAESYKDFNKVIYEKMKIMISRLQSFKVVNTILDKRLSFHCKLEGKLPNLSQIKGEKQASKKFSLQKISKVINIKNLRQKMKITPVPLSNETARTRKKHYTRILETLTQTKSIVYNTPREKKTIRGFNESQEEKDNRRLTLPHSRPAPNFEGSYEPFRFKTSLKIRNASDKPQILELYSSSFFENKSKVDKFKHQLEKKYPKRNMVYSKIILNSDYSIKATHDIQTMMDFCITEETKV